MDSSKHYSSRGAQRFGLAVVAIALCAIVGWSAIAPLDSAAIAPGVIAVESERSTVQHLEGGIVRALRVREGDLVDAGDVLVELDQTVTASQLEVTRSELVSRSAELARLQAERVDATRVDFDAVETEFGGMARTAIAAQREVFSTRRASRIGAENILRERIGQLEAREAGLVAQRESHRERLAHFDDELGRLERLQAEGFVGSQALLALRRERAEADALLAQVEGQINEARLSRGETELQILAEAQRFREEVAAELARIEVSAGQLRERLGAQRDTVERALIRAPRAGKVLGLTVRHPGSVVRPGEPIMELVPQQAPLIVKARVSPMDIDTVHIGLPARVQLSAFRSAVTPAVDGEVFEVSADRVVDAMSGLEYYEARVRLDADQIDRDLLSPGMPAEAMISTGERTLLAYLAQPITDTFARGMREK